MLDEPEDSDFRTSEEGDCYLERATSVVAACQLGNRPRLALGDVLNEARRDGVLVAEAVLLRYWLICDGPCQSGGTRNITVLGP